MLTASNKSASELYCNLLGFLVNMPDLSQGIRSADVSVGSIRPSPRRSTAFWVALVLWIASNVFANSVARISSWQGTIRYFQLSDFCKWDCGFYSSIVETGYWVNPWDDAGGANWVFTPLFPLTAYPLHELLKLPTPQSMVLTSRLELLLAIYAFLLMSMEDVESTADLFRAGSIVAFNPYVIYAHSGYAEPLYFALVALGFYFASRRRWVVAGAAGGLASVARVVGAVFAGSYLIAWLKGHGWRSAWRKLSLNAAIGLLLCPAGIALFMLYLHHHMGDALSVQRGHAAWGRTFAGPLRTLWLSILMGHWSRVWAVMMIAAWLAGAWLFKLRKPELGIFLILVLCVSALSPMQGYWGVARYIWWQPPFLYAIYRLVRRSEAAWLVYFAFASGTSAFMIAEWMTGHNFLV